MKKLLLLACLIFVFFLPKIVSPFFPYLVQSKLKGKVTIEKTSLSWMGPQEFENVHFSDKDFTAVIETLKSPVPFWKIGKIDQSFEVTNTSLVYGGDAKLTNIQATIKGNYINATGQTPQGGTLEIQGNATSSKDFDLKANLRKIPTILVDRLLNLKGYLYSAFGATLDAQGTYVLKNKKGAIQFNASSPSSSLFLDGQMTDDVLTLTKPLEASLFFTDKIGQIDIHAQTPATLNISPDGFRCPLKNLEAIQIKHASLDLGKVLIQGGDSLYSLAKLFNLSNRINFWFTPVTFSLKNGLIEMGRIDALLSNSVHLCAWGDINVKRDALDMTLGIPRDTLERSFGIRNLGRNYVLQIPVRGSLNNPKFDTGPAVAKIAAMTTVQEIPSTGGKIFGGLINLFTQDQDGDDAPAPNRPFPWEQ